MAVLLVVLYHAGVPGLAGGYVGVDVFFVISGYLITGHLLREAESTGRVSLLGFYGRRFRRLLPSATAVVAVTLVIARICLPTTQLRSLIKDAVFASFYGINYHLAALGINYQQSTAPPSPLQHFWSLAVEEQFYAAWPLIILICAFVGRRRLARPLTFAVLLVVTAVSLYLSVTLTRTNAPEAYFSLQSRAWELGFGALVAMVPVRWARWHRFVGTPMSWVALATIIGSAIVFEASTPFPGTAALYPVTATALMLWIGSVRQPGSAEVLLEKRPAQWVGQNSYSMYLWHWPMLILLPYVAGRTFSWERNLETLTLAAWVAFLAHWMIENPGMRSKAREMVWVVRGIALSATMATIAVVIGLTVPALVGDGAVAAQVTLTNSGAASLQKAINVGLTVSEVPRNLTPRADLAADDLPLSSTDRSRCMNNFLTTYQDPCVYGDVTASRTMVLFGDSHAQQWLGTFLPSAQKNGWRIVTINKAACPLADVPVYAPLLKREYTECQSWRDAAVARIRAMNPAMLVVSQSDLLVDVAVTGKQYASDTLATLQATHVRDIVYLADTPDPTDNPNLCLQEHLADATACAFPRSAAYQRPLREQDLLSAMTSAGYGYVDTLNYFCASACPGVVGNIAVWRDSGHMTNTYARFLAPLLSSLLPARSGNVPHSSTVRKAGS